MLSVLCVFSSHLSYYPVHSYGLFLKLYLQQCGPHKSILAKQLFVNEALTSIAQQVHNVRPKKAQKYNEFVQRELKKVLQKFR